MFFKFVNAGNPLNQEVDDHAVVYTLVLLVVIGSIWIKGIASLATFMGLASAGVAIAMHDTIANMAGWFFIIWRKPFKVGDRIEIGEIAGDVIDIRIFQLLPVNISPAW